MPSRYAIYDSNRRTVTTINNVTVLQDILEINVSSFVTFTANDATPSVISGRYFQTANTVATTITDFDNTTGDGHHLVIYINDAYTTIAHDATKIDMPGEIDQTFLAGDVIEFMSVGGVWKAWNSRTD